MPSITRWAAESNHDAHELRHNVTGAGPNLPHSFAFPARKTSPEHAALVYRACQTNPAVLPRWHQDDRGYRNRHRGVHHAAPAGAYTGLRPWTSREHWLSYVVPTVLALHERARRALKVGRDTFRRWATVESGYAQDQRTGRRVIVRPDVVASVMDMSERTVQNCRALARDIGLMVDVMPGRMLTQQECLKARRGGSPQRGLSNESALVIPNLPLQTGDSCTPTRGGASERQTHLDIYPPRKRGRTDAAPPRRPNEPGRPRTGVHRPAIDLAYALREALPWLRGDGARRIAPCLSRFLTTAPPWNAQELIAALETRALQRGKPMPHDARTIRTRPAALLAAMLRDIDADTDRYLPWDTPAPPPAWQQPCTHPDCDHGWIDQLDHAGRILSTPCPTCNGRGRTHPDRDLSDDGQPIDPDQPPF